MAYRDLDPDKIHYFLAKGTHEGELKRFFTESKAQLIMKQAKVQNLPYGRQERIRTICDRLPRSTDGVLRNWFQKNVTMADPMSADDVVTDLTLYEQMNEPIPDEHGARLARSALVHLFSEDPPPTLVAFLNRKTGAPEVEHPAKPVDAEGNHPTEAPQQVPGGNPIATSKLAELLAAVISGEEASIDEALAPFPDSIQTMVDALLATRSGDIDTAKTLATALKSDSDESRLLQQALQQARHRPTSTTASSTPSATPSVAPMPSGIRVNEPQPFKDSEEIEDFEIVGVCSNEADKAIFVRPLCLVTNGFPALLTTDDRLHLFPESGDVMTFRTGGKRLPHRGEVVRWRVAERDDAGGKTKFHYVSEPSRVVEVIKVPFPSTAPDDIREHIKELISNRKSVALQPQLFALSDGLVISSPGDPGKDEVYEQPWQCWSSLETWLLEGRLFCFGMPQPSGSQLDLSPLEAAFKRLIKNIVDAKKASFTKNQIRDLAGLIRANHAGETASRAHRIADVLDRVVIDSGAIDTLLPMLASRDEVRLRVDEIVDKEVSERLKERAGLLTEADELRRKKEDLTRESKEIERRISSQKSEVEASVARTFARAMEDGIGSLAQAEIFRSLAGVSESRRNATATGKERLPVRTRDGAISRDQGVERLVTLGVKRRQAVALTLLTLVVGRAGGCLVVRGREARQTVRTLAQIESDTSVFLEVPMGLTSTAKVSQFLEDLPRSATSLAVLDADLSPIEAYGGPLLDRQFDAAFNGCKTGSRLLLSCIGGDLSLPLPQALRRIAVVIDLDTPSDHGNLSLGEIEEETIPLVRSLYTALVGEVGQLQGAERVVVESLLAQSFGTSL